MTSPHADFDADFDVVVIGGGHAGAEAAWAASGMGAAVALVTLRRDTIGQMSCNPAIGGLAKGQLVREVDALGGLMGEAADATGLQFRLLNRSKGPAVRGPRCQSDKYRYAAEVRRRLETRPGVTIVEGEVVKLRPHVTLADGRVLRARATVLTTGTFMRGLMHTGEARTPGGRHGEPAAGPISTELQRLGLELGRLKTGTPPRLRAGTIDLARFEEQPGDPHPEPFSFTNEPQAGGSQSPGWIPPLRQIPCHIAHTTPAAHDVIRANLHRAPMFTGQIEAAGPRYCPSIEDKVTRFADKPRHQLFLEPESLDTDEVYVNGLSTSLPADAQRAVLDAIPGLDRAEVIRHGYAVEYDMVWPWQVTSTLEAKAVPGLFLAGQINGTSGYEEAAAQGLVAGVNAAKIAAGGGGGGGGADFVLGRDQAYVGVLVDDLVTKHPTEPYRMFTSRAEHRLALRADNADARLTPLGRDLGTVDDARWRRFEAKRDALAAARAALAAARVDAAPAADHLRRPEVGWAELVAAAPELADVPRHVGETLASEVKYAGYIDRTRRDRARLADLEHKPIPPGTDYATIPGLRNEARQALERFTPRNLGQAGRLAGLTPADVNVLAVHLKL